MSNSSPIGLVVLLGALVIAIFGRTWEGHGNRGKPQMTRLTEKMRTVCVGRFLIDMPEQAQIDVGRASVNGFDIATLMESTDEFNARIARREAELKAKPDRLGGNKSLESVKEVSTASGLVGKIFVHSRAVNEGTAGNGLETEHYRYEGIAVEALVHGDGVSIDLGSDFYFPEKLDEIHKLVTQLVPNPRSETPGEPGFCLDRAYIRDPLRADQGEQITMFAKLPSHPDFDLLLILAAGAKPDNDGLLKRGAASENRLSLAEKMRVTRLRAQPRSIGGLAGEELIRRVVDRSDAQVYTFRWELNGTEDDVFTPHLVFSMTTGKGDDGPVKTSMSEDAVLELWDKISSSIRLRPGGRPQVRVSAKLFIPIGSHDWAGNWCQLLCDVPSGTT
ncbi:T6SS immunity protein Tli4 family protein [Massilia sp. 9I]|uniref:T6SS immunity protein Tli4 family protein n=1 Tax=Massilia sp. 9I TaxID=2653152 RepID=UPI0012F03BD4|nr:T6SS immunity protein Tli4 family protein [Massilia sp. 9I]VXB67682.1 hypothetical protein MASSI9I_50030 [Massilia sp. 9I]